MSETTGSAINDVIAAAYRLHAQIVAAGDTVAGEHGLSAARWQVLGVIALDGVSTVPDLARRLGTARQSVQRIVSEMIDDGLLALTDNPRHRRSKLVGMTARGRKAYDAVMTAWAPNAATLERNLGPDNARILAQDMSVLADTFREIANRTGRAKEASDGTTIVKPEDHKNEP